MLHQTWPRSELGASGACRRGRSQQCQLHHVSPSHRVLKDWGAPEAAGITGSCGASRWPKELSWWPRLHGLDLCHWAAPPAPLTSDSINLTGKQGSGFPLCSHPAVLWDRTGVWELQRNHGGCGSSWCCGSACPTGFLLAEITSATCAPS